MEERAARIVTVLLYCAAGVGALWLGVRFLLPWTAPFLVAFALAALMEPMVKTLSRRGVRRGIAAALVTLLMLALLVTLAVWLVSWGIGELTDMTKKVPALMEGAGETVKNLELRARSYIRAAPPGIAGYLETAMDSVFDTLTTLPATLSRWALDTAAKTAQNSPGTILFAVTAGIGTYFFSASFPKTLAFLKAQLPDKLRERLGGLGEDMKQSFGGWLRAQLILMVMTFAELTAAFFIMKIQNAVGLAAITAFVDALPVFGTGIVLGPWAAYTLLLGDYGRGVGLLISWAAVNLVRNFAQAKLLGDQIGLEPIVSLLSIYVGWRVWGVWGMLVFPILFVTLQQLNDKGVIRLFREL